MARLWLGAAVLCEGWACRALAFVPGWRAPLAPRLLLCGEDGAAALAWRWICRLWIPLHGFVGDWAALCLSELRGFVGEFGWLVFRLLEER